MKKKLTDTAVRQLKRLKRQGWSNKELAFRFRVATATVSRIVNGRRRSGVS